MAIKITGDEIRFTSASGEVTTYKQEDAKDVFVKRKTDDGLPMKRLRSFESASTFIDLNASGITPLGHSSPRGGFTKGESIDIFVKDNYEAFHIDPYKISLGVKHTLPIELTGSLFSSGVSSSFDFSQMSMDISQGGFFGLAVSGSSLASNLHNMANNLSGLFLTGSNVIISGSTSLSGSTTFEGGDTIVSQSADDTLIVSGGNANYETDVNVDVTNPSSSFDISGSSGSVTFEVSGGNTNINSEFTQSGPATFDGGTTTINSDPSSSLSGSDALVVTDPSGSGTAVIDTVLTGWDNDIPVTSSITLTNAAHGLGRQVMVRSGSGVGDTDLSPQSPYYGLPTWSGSHKVAKPGPAGTIELTLPAATIGLSFNIVNHQFPAYPWGDYYHPNVKVSPSGSNKFIYGAGGSAGVAGKAIILPSGSGWQGDNVVVSCVSQSHWMIQQIGGTWTDEA